MVQFLMVGETCQITIPPPFPEETPPERILSGDICPTPRPDLPEGPLRLPDVPPLAPLIVKPSKTAFAAEIKPLKGWVWSMFDGALTILFGILVLAFLGDAALWLVGLLLGIKLLFAGWDLVYLGLALKKA